jgi:putative glycosyltransferase (TIGR04348 family)
VGRPAHLRGGVALGALRVFLASPAAAGSRQGNRVTAERWARRLAELGHEAEVGESWSGEPADLLVALHARKSHASVARWRAERPGAPLVVALTGTDLYADLPGNAEARRSLDLADRLVVLQPLALEALTALGVAERAKARVLRQSAEPPSATAAATPDPEAFEVCVLAHLRPVKDPLLAARAARLLPASSRLRVVHAGAALDPDVAAQARAEAAENRRYRWLGELRGEETAALLARSRLLALTSRLEGGANVVSEAIVAGVPVVATRVAGSVGLLGEDYPGFFPVGDAPALAALLTRAEGDPRFLADLAARGARLAPLFAPERERAAWAELLAELTAL